MAKALRGQVLFKVDTRQKETLSLTDDITISISKGYDFNLRVERSSRGICIDGEGIPEGADICFHHNATDATFQVPPQHFLTQEEVLAGWGVYNADCDSVFIYRVNGVWHPYKNFLITSRIFKKYVGAMVGVPTEQIKNRLYVVSGTDRIEQNISAKEYKEPINDLSGKVIVVTENSDYQIIFHDTDNKEYSVIRTRAREVLAIDNELTERVNNGEYLVGITEKDAQPIKIFHKFNSDEGIE